jgi:hypothetical protein
MQQRILVMILVAVAASVASAQIFDDNFDDGAAAGRWSAPFFSTELDPPVIDGVVDYALDYSAFGIPAAPNSAGTTIGLGIQVNNTDQPADEGEAIGVSPMIMNLPGDYSITADVFIYYAGGAGSSEHAIIGVNSDQSGVPFVFEPAGAGVNYHIPHNSGLSGLSYPDDYYRIADGTVTGLYGDQAGLDDPDTLGIPFVGTDPIFDDPGYAGNRWFSLELTKSGNEVSLFIEGVLIDTFDTTGGTTDGDIVLAGADIFNSANPDNWIIWDNVNVVPEPASLLLIGLAGLALRRR